MENNRALEVLKMVLLDLEYNQIKILDKKRLDRRYIKSWFEGTIYSLEQQIKELERQEIQQIKFADTPRFLRVRLQAVYPSVTELRQAGYTETTHYRGNEYYTVWGKHTGTNQMEFAACKEV